MADARPPAPASKRPHPGGERTSREGFRRFIASDGGTNRNHTLASTASIVAAGFVLSRLLGLVRSMVIADAFGTDPALSAYWVAFRLPDLVFQLLSGATLSAAFIPTFSRVMLRDGEDAGWRMAARVLNLITLATFAAAAVAFVLAPVLVPALAPGLGEATGREDELRALAVDLTRLMLLSPLFFGISGMLTGILNARQHFIAPAIAPVLYNLGIIVGAVALAGPFGIHGLAWGGVAGSAAHLLVQVPALRRVGMRWSPSLALSEGVLDVVRLMGPRVLGLAATQVSFLAAIFFASFVSDEAISALNYAFLMMMLPVGVIGMAISTAVFPTLAQHGAAQDTAALRAAIAKALRLILFLAVPASAGLIILARPTVRVLLERGAFDTGSTDLVVSALTIYAIGIVAHCGVEILSRGFYALSDTRTPVAIAVAAMVLGVALSGALVAPFGLRGLAGAASISAMVEFALLIVVLGGRIGGIEGAALLRTVRSTVFATGALAIAMLATLELLRLAGIEGGGAPAALAQVAAAGLVGLLAFGGAGYLANREEMRMVVPHRAGGAPPGED